MVKKERADILVYIAGLADSRERAKRLIMMGRVFIKRGNGLERIDKPGHQLRPGVEFTLGNSDEFVSRGAYKLLTALEHFSLAVDGFIILDAGASTGGFTDCLLQKGAAKVYAVDVGHNQLHEKLRRDSRVVCMEGVNLRLADDGLINEQLDMIVSDVSFISLTLVLGPCVRWLKKDGIVAALIKPQFELGPGCTVKGIVRDEVLRQKAVEKVLAYARNELKLTLLGVVASAIKGPKGNQEYMAVWQRSQTLSK